MSLPNEDRTSDSQNWRTPIVGAWVLFLGVVLSMPVLYSLHSALPPNAITLPFESQTQVLRWAPQGWGFFTRNPREPQIVPFLRNGHWRSANLGPHAQFKYALGLNRRSRAQGVEMGLLLGKLGIAEWTPCEAELATCLE